MLGRWWIGSRALPVVFLPVISLMGAMLVLAAACGGDSIVTSTTAPVSTEVPTQVPTKISPTSVPGNPLPATTIPPTPSPATSTPEPPSIPGPLPTTAGSNLRVTSPEINTVGVDGEITVTGVTRPDATISVNGILAIPSPLGDFSVELQLSVEESPVSIEVIASSLTGEEESIVLNHIFVGDSSETQAQGIFGTISSISGDHPRSISGETDIVLSTADGPVELITTSDTIIRIPGLAAASVDRISLDELVEGDQVAVLFDHDTAITISVLVSQPVRTGHFTGIVTSIDAGSEDKGVGTLTVQGLDGETIEAPWLGDPDGPKLGELVTVVMEQDLAKGSLIINDLNTAQDSLERLAAALEVAQAQALSTKLEELKGRLLSHTAIWLTILGEASDRFDSSLQSRVLQQLASAIESSRVILARYDAGDPQKTITGIVTSIDLDRRVITVENKGLKLVEVSVSNDASFWRAPGGLPTIVAEAWLGSAGDTQRYASEFGGRESRFQQLDLANRVKLRYGLDTGRATRIMVLPAASLQSGQSRVLLGLSTRGAAMGTVTSVDADSQPPTLKIQDEISRRTITLSVLPDTKLMEGQDTVELSTLTGAMVDASYDLGAMALTVLNASSADDRSERAHGVVYSLVPKVAPGNFVVLTLDGDLRVFNHNGDTGIFRDGRQVTITQVRIGDLVQPATHYLPGSGDGDDLVVLRVKSPLSARVEGTIRGISNTSGTVITITNNRLELITITVDENTSVSREGTPFTLGDLVVGQVVSEGNFDPISGVAQNLLIYPPQNP